MGRADMLSLVPVSLKDANTFVSANHRHHKTVTGHKFSIGCAQDGRLVGVAQRGPRANPAKQFAWGEEEQRNE